MGVHGQHGAAPAGDSVLLLLLLLLRREFMRACRLGYGPVRCGTSRRLQGERGLCCCLCGGVGLTVAMHPMYRIGVHCVDNVIFIPYKQKHVSQLLRPPNHHRRRHNHRHHTLITWDPSGAEI